MNRYRAGYANATSGAADQTAATTGNGSILLTSALTKNLTVAIVGTGTITAGAVTVEEAYYSGGAYSGTWSSVQIVDVTAKLVSNALSHTK